MDRLRSAILQSRALDAQQEIDELLSRRSTVPEILGTFYFCAAQLLDATDPLPDGLLLVHNLDRALPDLERLEQLSGAFRCVARFLSHAPKVDAGAVEPPVPPPPGAELGALVAQDNTESVAGFLLGLEDPDREDVVQGALLDFVMKNAGPGGQLVVSSNSFLHGFERVGRDERAALARHAARHLVARAKDGSPPADPQEEEPPIPGDPTAAALLAALREFNAPASLAALNALVATGGEEDAVRALLVRACENAGSDRHNLALAVALTEMNPRLPAEERQRLCQLLAACLLRRHSSDPVVENVASGIPAKSPDARRQQTLEKELANAIRRCDPQAALDAARPLLVEKEGVDRVSRSLLAAATSLPEPQTFRALGLVTTTLMAAYAVGWPAARVPLLRAVYTLSAERYG